MITLDVTDVSKAEVMRARATAWAKAGFHGAARALYRAAREENFWGSLAAWQGKPIGYTPEDSPEAYEVDPAKIIVEPRKTHRSRGDGDQWRVWALFRGDVSDADALAHAGFYQYYMGPGQPFGGAPVIRRSRGYVLVTAWGGLDI